MSDIDLSSLQVNLADVDSGFEPIPAGSYPCKVTDIELTKTSAQAKNPDVPMIKFELTVQGGDYDGRKVFTNAVLLPQTMFNLKGIMEASERFTEEELNASQLNVQDIMEKLEGADVGAKVIIKPYQGEDVNNVKRVIPLSKLGETGDASLLP